MAGEWIVYQGPQGLARVRRDGTEAGPFFADSVSTGSHPDWSPANTSMLFVRDEADGTTDIYVADSEGSHERRVVDTEEPHIYSENPSWSPDGTRIAFWTEGSTDTTQVIKVVDARTGKVTLTVRAPAYQGPVNPRWSPDGRYLAVNVDHYVAEAGDVRRDGGAIGLIDLTATRPQIRLITPFALQAAYPAWSPTGDRIMFVAGNLDPFFAQQDGPNNLFTIRPDGTELVQLTHQGPGDPLIAGPEWTTGEHPVLVTVIKGENDWNLATVDADGTRLADLVDASGTPIAGAHPRAMVSAG